MPRRRLFVEALQTRLGQAVLFRAPILFRHSPGGFDQALILQAVKCRIERSLLNLQHLARQLADASRNRPSVQRFGAKRFENQEIKRPLHEVDRLHCAFPMIIDTRNTAIV
jgi:hypothetical protein